MSIRAHGDTQGGTYRIDIRYTDTTLDGFRLSADTELDAVRKAMKRSDEEKSIDNVTTFKDKVAAHVVR